MNYEDSSQPTEDSSDQPTALQSGSMGKQQELPSNSVLSKSRISQDPADWLDRLADRCSNWCSSILIKETRQAIKSRQFMVTYLLLLAVCAIWAMIGLASTSNLSEGGPEVLAGFLMIMGFPLVIVVPFGAYRSLTREFEDGTLQLVSITSMQPWQIIAGKLGSAVLQMLVYLSVLAPCIAFTYLLRGIGIPQIVMGTVTCVSFSLCLTVLGLFLAGTTRSSVFSVGISVLLVILLASIYIGWLSMAEEIGRQFSMEDLFRDEGTVIMMGFIVFFSSTAALLFASAAAQISFPSENRATRLRMLMVVQQVLFFAWAIALLGVIPNLRANDFAEFPVVLSFVTGHYWLIMGCLMAGEALPLSRRVRRQLPKTFVGKTFGSLFMPGPGRGFLFATANVAVCWLLLNCLMLVALWQDRANVSIGMPGSYWEDALIGTTLSCLYALWYLSIVYLLMRWRQRFTKSLNFGNGPITALLIGVVVVGVICVGSLGLQFNLVDRGMQSDYSGLQMFNWYWTTVSIVDDSKALSHPVALFLFFIQAVVVIGIAIGIASRELLIPIAATPVRVTEDREQALVKVLPKGESIDEIFGMPPQ